MDPLLKDHSFHLPCSAQHLLHGMDYSKSSSGLPFKVAVFDVHGSSLGLPPLGHNHYTTPKIKAVYEFHSLILTASRPVPLECC